MKAMTVPSPPTPLPRAGEGRFVSRGRDFHIKLTEQRQPGIRRQPLFLRFDLEQKHSLCQILPPPCITQPVSVSTPMVYRNVGR